MLHGTTVSWNRNKHHIGILVPEFIQCNNFINQIYSSINLCDNCTMTNVFRLPVDKYYCQRMNGTNDYRVSTTPEILEIYWNLKTLLEISWNLIGPPGNFCVRCRRSTALVSSHKDRLFKKMVALFYVCYGPMLYKMHIILLFCVGWSSSSHAPLNSSRFGKLHRRPKQGKHVLDFS